MGNQVSGTEQSENELESELKAKWKGSETRGTGSGPGLLQTSFTLTKNWVQSPEGSSQLLKGIDKKDPSGGN